MLAELVEIAKSLAGVSGISLNSETQSVRLANVSRISRNSKIASGS